MNLELLGLAVVKREREKEQESRLDLGREKDGE